MANLGDLRWPGFVWDCTPKSNGLENQVPYLVTINWRLVLQTNLKICWFYILGGKNFSLIIQHHMYKSKYIYVYIYSYPPPTKIKITNIGHTEHSHNIHMTAIISPVTGIGQVAALALQLERRLRPRLRRRVAVARCQAGRAAQRPRQLGNVGGDLGRWRLRMGVTSNGVAKGFHRNEYVFNMFRYVLILIWFNMVWYYLVLNTVWFNVVRYALRCGSFWLDTS